MEIKENSFIIVTPENVQNIAGRLYDGKGMALIAEPGSRSSREIIVDAHLSLYAHPLISLKGSSWFDGPYLYTERGTKKIGGIDWQTKWQDDRDYLLRPKPAISRDPLINICRDLSERLSLENFEFKIGPQGAVGTTLFCENRMIAYIPEVDYLRQAFSYGLRSIINQMGEEEKKKLIKLVEKITDYIIEDFKNGKIFRKNVSAGMEADQILGM